jgi:phosphotransferase system enzyme I (PtsI)
MTRVAGLATSRGFAAGPVFVYRGDADLPVPQYVVDPGEENEELLRLKRALADTKRDLETLISVLRERTGREDVKVFECHLMILEDLVLIDETQRYILDDRLNAAAAVRKTADRAREQFARMNDPYFRERVRDLDDVERRLLKVIIGTSGEPHLELKTPSIVVADDLTPSETVQLPREYVLGFVTNGGSTTSHVALLARSMGLPAVSGTGNITELVMPGEWILLDGTNGEVVINADEETRSDFDELIARERELSEAAGSGAPAGTLKGGGRIEILANVQPGVPMGPLKDIGARGIGLYRSEYLWLNRELEPSIDEQFEAYRHAIEFASSLGEGSGATIRMLDIGGDKTVKGITMKEANPFLGNRSIRYLLSHPEVFVDQLRAVLRASAYGRVKIMYPMVSTLEELDAADAMLEEVKRELDSQGVEYDRDIKTGIMVEVPAAALNSRALARRVSFFSIGTNDLVQYAMAADRANEAVAHLYQPTHPAVIKLVRMTIDAAKEAGIGISVCGESASDVLVGVLWAAMGVKELSMSATYIPAMAKVFSCLSRADLEEYRTLAETMADEGARSHAIYTRLGEWMEKKLPDAAKVAI